MKSLIVAAGVILSSSGLARSTRETFVPESDDFVVAEITSQTFARQLGVVSRLRQLIATAHSPQLTIDQQVELAQRLYSLGRESDEPRYVAQAYAAAKTGLSVDSDNRTLIETAADAAAFLHRLEEADAYYARLRDVVGGAEVKDARAVERIALKSAFLAFVRGRLRSAAEHCANLAAASGSLCLAQRDLQARRFERARSAARVVLGGESRELLSDAERGWGLEIVGQSYMYSQRSAERAMAAPMLADALEIEPSNVPRRLLLADAYLAQGHGAKAAALFKLPPSNAAAALRVALAQVQTHGTMDASLREWIESWVEVARVDENARHERELAFYYARITGDDVRAKDYALKNFAYQRDLLDQDLVAKFAPKVLNEWLASIED